MGSERATNFFVDFTTSTDYAPRSLERIRSLLVHAAARVNLDGEVGIWLCTDDEIADLHVRFMSVEGPTDVITFPGEGQYLGDIAVSVDIATEQASDAGHSTEREVAYLCLHGLLHLAGYDDLDESARGEMIRRQDELLQSFEEEYLGDW